jgi:hypothetical protein
MVDISKEARIAADWWKERLDAATPEQQETFRAKLEELINVEFNNPKSPFVFGPSDDPWLKVQTDYDPDEMLVNALDAAGIAPTGFIATCDGLLPRKHMLQIHKGYIEVKEGYGYWVQPILVS